ncbi:hypothetical protein Moror_2373 [Moniliophthora roreri MCA 2997]|uniref:Nephrocystin 3-like N-terminal domain-containing protein n=1 Tax=Moniliophthora roreri (strain MCA 2997) TaxID=1381753 RepID=V2Y2I2_MONRO|nr:hypothetical protein Moror_2373 [Moniliophthora roreri MCA 2997]
MSFTSDSEDSWAFETLSDADKQRINPKLDFRLSEFEDECLWERLKYKRRRLQANQTSAHRSIRLSDTKRSKILNWISPLLYEGHRNYQKRDVLRGTGQWLLQDRIYTAWKSDSASSLLWLHGIPGAGKSKLVSIVVEDLLQSFRDGMHPRPTFFYCSRDTAEPEIIASLARQLASAVGDNSLLKRAVDVYKKHRKGTNRIPDQKGEFLFRQLVRLLKNSYVVIDAIDECDHAARRELLNTLVGLLDGNLKLAKILITSRDDQDIVDMLQRFPSISIGPQRNSDDVSKFTDRQTRTLISKGRLLCYSREREQLKEDIVSKLTEQARGMFRWVSMQLECMCGSKLDNDVRERLGICPGSLKELYHKIYSKIMGSDTDERVVAGTVFNWLLVGRKILRTPTFLAAISANPIRWQHSDKIPEELTLEQVLAICRNLVVHDEDLDTFRFAHPSVREFLESMDDYSNTRCHSFLAESCLIHEIYASHSPRGAQFLSTNYGIGATLPSTRSLREYAFVWWPVHYFHSDVGDGNYDRRMLDLFMFNSPESVSHRAHDTDRIISKAVSFLAESNPHDTNYRDSDEQTVQERFNPDPLYPRNMPPISIANLRNWHAFEQLLNRALGHDLPASVVVASWDVFEYLLERDLNYYLPPYEMIVSIAVRIGMVRDYPCDMPKMQHNFRQLLAHVPPHLITKEMLMAAAENGDVDDPTILQLLQRAGDNTITSDVLQAAASRCIYRRQRTMARHQVCLDFSSILI